MEEFGISGYEVSFVINEAEREEIKRIIGSNMSKEPVIIVSEEQN